MEWNDIKVELPALGQVCFISDRKVVAVGVASEGYVSPIWWDGFNCGGHDFEFDFRNEDVSHWIAIDVPNLPE